MSEYAVAWKDSAEPFALYVGGLTVHETGLRLRGSAGYAPVVREVAKEEIDKVERVRGASRLAGFPSLRVSLKGGQSLLIASVTGRVWEGLTKLGRFKVVYDDIDTLFYESRMCMGCDEYFETIIVRQFRR